MKKLLLAIPLLLCVVSTHAGKKSKKPQFKIKYSGTEFPVDYKAYGTFRGEGTSKFKYKISDREGLAAALGSGIYPNFNSLSEEPHFKKWAKKKPRKIVPWDYINTGDPQTEFYVWGSAKGMGPGAKLYFTAEALADANLYQHALKAYYAILIHFAGEPVWSADHSFVWYVGPAALNRIKSITQHHPEIGYRLKNAYCNVKNASDTNLNNDEVIVDPGRWVKRGEDETVDLDKLDIVDERGNGTVRLIQYENKHWQLLVDDEPFIIRGMNYQPTKVGAHVSDGKGNAWMYADENKNGFPDPAYDSWIDWNGNNKKDRKDKAIGDFQIMRDMGVNAIRIFRGSQDLNYDPSEFNKKVLRDLHERYGIYVVMGEFLGAYTVGSGADWDTGTDYTNKTQLKNMKNLVRAYVNDHKDEPYVLLWLLGNENLMPSDYSGVNATRTQASKQVKAYLKFVNEIAEMIHKIDPNHPVAVGNLGLTNLDEHAKYAPAVDIFGANSYPGEDGFGNMWNRVQRVYDRAVLVTEYGCDAFNSKKSEEDQTMQEEYHRGNWNDIQLNVAGGSEEGNAIGGIIFEFLDEWWKSTQGSWNNHDDGQDSPMAFPDGWSSEEWFGIFSQGDGEHSPFLRQPRKAFFLYRDELWK